MQIKLLLPLASMGISLTVLTVLISCGSKSDELPLSSGIETASGQAAAMTMLNQAKAYEASGKISKAVSTYSDIAKRYPYASVASEARYAEGR
ncbi:MAG: hypothetical protein KJO79_10015, partial [Verrucomicrobiae bacterium]|nr:hypothetical protein [Verrucomicrobiae bacterium]NNJ87507.1 hypothetical protein [Akkermansiaceae bacterium]